MPDSSNTGNAAAGRQQLRDTPRSTSRTTRSATTAKTTETAAAPAPDKDTSQPEAKKGRFERPSGIDPTVDHSAGQKAVKDQHELNHA